MHIAFWCTSILQLPQRNPRKLLVWNKAGSACMKQWTIPGCFQTGTENDNPPRNVKSLSICQDITAAMLLATSSKTFWWQRSCAIEILLGSATVHSSKLPSMSLCSFAKLLCPKPFSPSWIKHPFHQRTCSVVKEIYPQLIQKLIT